MKSNILAAAAVAAALFGAGLFLANAQAPVKPPPDPRIDKLLEQNDRIIKGQEEILKALGDIKEGLLQVRRRSS